MSKTYFESRFDTSSSYGKCHYDFSERVGIDDVAEIHQDSIVLHGQASLNDRIISKHLE